MKLTKEYIENKYPEMFKECFDFSIGDGWLPLILSFCVAYKGEEILQIKSKFGSLRLYLKHYSNEAQVFISGLEGASYYICEDCGRPSEVKTSGWIKTMCKECIPPNTVYTDLYK